MEGGHFIGACVEWGLVASKGTYEGLNMSKRLRLIAIALSCRERATKLVYRRNRSHAGDVPRRTAIGEMRGWRAQSATL